jgi:ADP-ribose pyrophosphatase YjhB (NUDIX family)
LITLRPIRSLADLPWRDEAPSAGRPQRLICEGDRPVGLVFDAEIAGTSANAIWVRECERGRGVGDAATEALIEGREPITCAREDVEYFVERGYRLWPGQAVVLEPPSARSDLRAAASACLYHAASSSILLGQRRTSSWHQFWAFPGGGLEEGESLQECAVRELFEETSVAVSGTPIRSRRVYVGVGDGSIAYSVTNFMFAVDQRQEPQDSDELHSEWFTLEQARALRPMAAGTRRILRLLEADLP